MRRYLRLWLLCVGLLSGVLCHAHHPLEKLVWLQHPHLADSVTTLEPHPLWRQVWLSRHALIEAIGHVPGARQRYLSIYARAAPVTGPADETTTAARAELAAGHALYLAWTGQRWQALQQALTALEHAQRLLRHQPGHPTGLKVVGITQLAASTLPGTYRWFARQLGIPTDATLGWGQLQQATRLVSPLQLETQLLHAAALRLVRRQATQAQAALAQLGHDLPHAVPLAYLQASALLAQAQGPLADRVMKTTESLRPDAEQAFPLWGYGRGRLALMQLNAPVAQQHLKHFTQRAQPPFLLQRDAQWRLGIAWLLQGQVPQAQTTWVAVAGLPPSEADDDQAATQTAAQWAQMPPQGTALALLKARLLADGGYYAQAQLHLSGLLAGIDTCSTALQAEFWYRMGRVAQAQGRAEAAAYYRACVATDAPPEKATGEPTSRWMRVHALFYWGEVLATQGQHLAARERWQQALKCRNYAYRNGLEQRLHAALATLPTTAHE